MPQDFVFDIRHHLPTFGIEYPDSRIKTSFLLTDVSDLSSRRFQSRDLNRYGLRSGIDYFVIGVSELAHTSPNPLSMRGSRVVLSLPGLLKLTVRARTDFGDEVADWVLDTVVPELAFAQPQISDHPTLHMVRDVVADLTDGIAGHAQHGGFDDFDGRFGMGGELTLGSLVGTAVNVVQEDDNT